MDALSDLSHTLEEIGLTEKEAAVYLALLSLETATAYQIAEHCDVKKPTVYVILEELRKKGLVLKVPHAKKALFAAQDLVEYVAAQESRLKAAHAILPRLHALGSKPKEGVYFFNGLHGIAQALDYKFDEMRGNTFHSFYGSFKRANPEIVRLSNTWDAKAVRSGMSFNIILPETDKAFQKELLELARKNGDSIRVRFSEEYASGTTFVEIGDDFVRITDAEKLTSTIIDNGSVAEAMRQIFNIAWHKGQKHKAD